ncbi:hypothetical protein Tco_0448905 [Tanacetum coccineum]
MVPFIKELGYTSKCISGKSTGLDRLRPSRAQILWGMFNQKNVDYIALLWEDFMFQADNKEISSAHDTLLGTLKFVSKTKDYQKYGALIPEEMINQAIKDSKEYKTYLKFASGKFTPMNTRNLSWAKNLNREAAKTAKKTARANSYILCKQLKALKKSKQDTHMLHASGLGDGVGSQLKFLDELKEKTTSTHERTSTIPRVPDVPKVHSESENESWGDSEDDDDSNDDDSNDDDGNDLEIDVDHEEADDK